MPGEELALQALGNVGSGVTQSAFGAAETVIGLINNAKAKKEAEKLAASRPKLKSSPFVKDQLALAESNLSTGMGAETKAAYEGGLSRDLSTSLDTILKGGGSVNNVSQVFDASQQGRQRLALIRENMRLNNINNLVRAQDTAEHERQQMFQFNTWAPWVDEAKANAQARQQAQGQIWSGIDTVGSGLMKAFGGGGGSNKDTSLNMAGSKPSVSMQPNYQQPNVAGANPINPNAPTPTFNYPDYTEFSDLG